MDINQRHKDYYKTIWWKKFVKQILEPDDTVCEICGCRRWRHDRKGNKKINRVFNIHHKNYNHLFHETKDDVQVLCRRCHQMLHDILKIKSGTNAVDDLKTTVRKYFIYV